MSESAPSNDHEKPVIDTRRLAVRSGLLFLILLGFTLTVVMLDLPHEELARRAVERGGLVGVFFFVLLVDTFMVPATLDLVFPFTMEWPVLPLLAMMSVATIAGGACGYWIGRGIGRMRFVRRTVAGYYARNLKIVTRFGFWGVVLAALTPIPFSTVSWIAGIIRMPFGLFITAALARAPRVVTYWALLRLGVELLL